LPPTDRQGLRLGTAIAVAVARNPMTVATIAKDLQRGLRRLARR
jgi:hypothetical protein